MTNTEFLYIGCLTKKLSFNPLSSEFHIPKSSSFKEIYDSYDMVNFWITDRTSAVFNCVVLTGKILNIILNI